MPPDDDMSQVRCVRDNNGDYIVGQFDKRDAAKIRGVVRKFDKEGSYLAEYLMLDGVKIGLIRHINRFGCVAYIVQDTVGDRIESKFFDSAGLLV